MTFYILNWNDNNCGNPEQYQASTDFATLAKRHRKLSKDQREDITILPIEDAIRRVTVKSTKELIAFLNTYFGEEN